MNRNDNISLADAGEVLKIWKEINFDSRRLSLDERLI
jgi:hypothetical protein